MDTNRFGRFDVLVIEPDASATASAREALEQTGARSFVVGDLAGARRALASHRIGAVVLGPSLSTRDAREILDGLAFERASRPRIVRMSPRDPSAARLGHHIADVLAYVPVIDAAVVAALGVTETSGAAGPPHVASLIRLSSLNGGIGEAMREVASTLQLAFAADACIIVGTASSDAWIVGTGASLSQTELVEVRERILGAARGRTMVVASEMVTRGVQGACGFETFLGARIIGDDNVRVGLIALVQHGFRDFRSEEQELLTAVGRRLATELSHRGVKDHLVAELDATRDAGGLDPLLGVWSESTLLRLLEMMVSASLRNGAPLTVAVIDVRELGRINDLYGHTAGDAVLKHVAELTVYVVRASDVVARYRGGIAVVFSGTGPADAATVVKRVQRVFASEDFVVDAGMSIHVDTRSGISFLENEGDNAELLLQRAIDAAQAASETEEGLWTSTQPAPEGDLVTPIGGGDEGLRGVTLGGMYRLLHEIGSGSGGGVYRGEDLGLNRPVAIKVLNPEQAHTEDAIERFRAEAAILASLRHPNLVQVYAFGVDVGYAYFVMELVEGESVEAAIDRRREEGRQFPLAMVKSIVKQIGFALDTLHRSGVVHRDVKPANILIDPFRDRAVLVDVGIARKTGDVLHLAGTPPYMAPEIFSNPNAGLELDVFGFAATVYEMLVLETPWPPVEDVYELVKMKETQPPKPLAVLRPELAVLDPIFERGLHPDPDERHDSITALAAELRRAISGLEQETSGPPRKLSGQMPVVRESEPAPKSLRSSWVTKRVSGQEPLTRIAVFRAFARVLGARRIARWRVDLARQDPALADALSPTKPPLGWLPTKLMHALLTAAPREGEDPERLGRELGRATVRATFRRFFPASPETLSSRSIVAAVDKIWAQYHSWGTVETVILGSGQATVIVDDVVESAALRGWVVGMLEQVVHFSGGADVAVACDAPAGGPWRIELNWT